MDGCLLILYLIPSFPGYILTIVYYHTVGTSVGHVVTQYDMKL